MQELDYTLLLKNGYEYDIVNGGAISKNGIYFDKVEIDGQTFTSDVSQIEFDRTTQKNKELSQVQFTYNPTSSYSEPEQREIALQKQKAEVWKKKNYEKYLKVIEDNPGISFTKPEHFNLLIDKGYSPSYVYEILEEQNQIKKRDSIILVEKQIARKESIEEVLGWITPVLGLTLFIGLIVFTLKKILK